jgi:hypothetical protein
MNPARTNQKLYFAKQALAQAMELRGQDALEREEACLLHMYGCFYAFCAELVAHYRLQPFSRLEELLARQGLPSEFNELNALLQDPDQWLKQLHRLYQQALVNSISGQQSGTGLISSAVDYQGLFANWLNQLDNLILRVRQHYQEC